jgi:hypothetical protein
MPFGLRALKGVNIARIFSSNRSDLTLTMCGGSSPPKLIAADIDSHFLRNITRMLNDRINMKLTREEKQKEELQKWLREEKERRWVDKIRKQRELEIEEQRREERRRKCLEEVQRGDYPNQTVLLSTKESRFIVIITETWRLTKY